MMRLDVDNGKTESFDFGVRCRFEEHVVPTPGSHKEGEPWLLSVGFRHRQAKQFHYDV